MNTTVIIADRSSRLERPDRRTIARHLVSLLHDEARCRDTLIVQQRDIGWREGRIDVVLLNGALSGFKIKSGRGSLALLPRQAQLFSSVLDYATIVCDERHLAEAAATVPHWWGIRRVGESNDELRIDEMRAPRFNRWVLPHRLARMLHRDELYVELARRRGIPGLSSQRQADLAWILVDTTTPDELREIVRRWLRQRPSWQAAALRT